MVRKLWVLLFFCVPTWASESVFVHSAKAKIKSEKSMGAADVHVSTRGEELQVIKQDGMWFQVKVAGKEGWVSKLFVKKQKPIGQAALFKEAALNEEKSSRKRSSAYAVSGATRGLTANTRVRGQREQYRSDFQTLEELEKFELETGKVKKFLKKGGLEP